MGPGLGCDAQPFFHDLPPGARPQLQEGRLTRLCLNQWRRRCFYGEVKVIRRSRPEEAGRELYGLPIMTSVALMRATAGSPGLRASSRTASAVMMAVTR